jgi:hypothetical protein
VPMLALPWHEALLNQPHEEDHDDVVDMMSLPADNAQSPPASTSNWTYCMEQFWYKSHKTDQGTTLKMMLSSHMELCEDSLRRLFDVPAVRQTLLQYLESKNMCDVNLVTNDGVIHPVHKVMLLIHSEYYRTLFAEEWWAAHQSTTVQVDCDNITLHAVLTYLYSGDISHIAQCGDAIECLRLGHMLLIGSLIEDLLPLVIDSVDEDNACSLMAFAETLGFQRLKERCAMFVIKRLSNIQHSQYFADLSPRIRQSLQVLRTSYVRCATVNGDLYHDVRELMAMIKDSLIEAEEALREGKARNEEEIVKWTVASGGKVFFRDEVEEEGDGSSRGRRGATTWRTDEYHEGNAEEWRRRLLRVEASLAAQEAKLVRMRASYEEQRRALDVILLQEGEQQEEEKGGGGERSASNYIHER